MASSRSVLVVEDDSALRNLLVDTLERAGWSVCVADSGTGALAFLRARTVTLVITDLLMPEVDGLEVIMWTRKACPETRIVAMSAGGCIGDPHSLLRAARCLGAHAVIEKPFTLEEFLAVVDASLAGDTTTPLAPTG